MLWDDVLPRVLQFARNCPDAVALEHIRDAARRLCAHTLLWSYECDPIPTEAGRAAYTLPIGPDEEIVRVNEVFVGPEEYLVLNDRFARALERRRYSGHRARPNYGTKEINLFPVPAVSGAPIVIDVAVKPSLTSTEFPDDFRDHIGTIANGAVATLCALPELPWSSGAHAAHAQQLFTAESDALKYEVSRGHSRAARQNISVWF